MIKVLMIVSTLAIIGTTRRFSRLRVGFSGLRSWRVWW